MAQNKPYRHKPTARQALSSCTSREGCLTGAGRPPQHTAGHLRPTAGDTGTLSLVTELLHAEHSGSFRTTVTKDFKSNTVSQSRGPKTLRKAASARYKILDGEESEINFKRGARKAGAKPKELALS